MPVCREKNGKYKKCDKDEKESKSRSNSLTPKQKAKLPKELQKAILKYRNEK